MTEESEETREEAIKNYADFATWIAYRQGDYV